MDLKTASFCCDDCGSEYSVQYDEEEMLDGPEFCPFCGASLESYLDLNQSDMFFNDD